MESSLVFLTPWICLCLCATVQAQPMSVQSRPMLDEAPAEAPPAEATEGTQINMVSYVHI